MDLLEQFEHPLPVLKTGVEKLVLETTLLGLSGGFTVENVGGGELEGVIMSNNPCIAFGSESFKGNKVRVNYSIRMATYRNGDVIQTSVVIMSNGGEKIIPVIIKVIPPAITTDDGTTITSLKDFMTYAANFGVQARSLFASRTFAAWLDDSGFEHMDIYEYIRQDKDKARGLENFFILCKMKRKVTLSCDRRDLRFDIMPNVSEMIQGQLRIQRSGWGYVCEDINAGRGAKWLTLSPVRLDTDSFEGANTATIFYKINTGRIDKESVRGDIVIGDKLSVSVTVKKKKWMDVALEKTFLSFGETGYLNCVNNSGKDVLITVEASESFARFEGKRFLVGDFAKIPFTLHTTPFQAAQKAVKKQPVLTCDVNVSATIGGGLFKKALTLTVGGGFEAK